MDLANSETVLLRRVSASSAIPCSHSSLPPCSAPLAFLLSYAYPYISFSLLGRWQQVSVSWAAAVWSRTGSALQSTLCSFSTSVWAVSASSARWLGRYDAERHPLPVASHSQAAETAQSLLIAHIDTCVLRYPRCTIKKLCSQFSWVSLRSVLCVYVLSSMESVPGGVWRLILHRQRFPLDQGCGGNVREGWRRKKLLAGRHGTALNQQCRRCILYEARDVPTGRLGGRRWPVIQCGSAQCARPCVVVGLGKVATTGRAEK